MSRFGRIAVAVALVFRVEAQTSRMDDYLAQERKMSLLAREGYKLTRDQAASLEEALARMPDDLDGRARAPGTSQQDSVVAKAGADALAKMVSH
jgi:hypothetical protein